MRRRIKISAAAFSVDIAHARSDVSRTGGIVNISGGQAATMFNSLQPIGIPVLGASRDHNVSRLGSAISAAKATIKGVFKALAHPLVMMAWTLGIKPGMEFRNKPCPVGVKQAVKHYLSAGEKR